MLGGSSHEMMEEVSFQTFSILLQICLGKVQETMMTGRKLKSKCAFKDVEFNEDEHSRKKNESNKYKVERNNINCNNLLDAKM